MDNLARRFVAARQRDESLVLDGLSAAELSSAVTDLANVPEGADYFRALVRLGTKDGAEVATRLVAELTDRLSCRKP